MIGRCGVALENRLSAPHVALERGRGILVMAMAMAGAQVRREDWRVQDLGGSAGTFNTAERGHCVPSAKTGCRRQGAHALRL